VNSKIVTWEELTERLRRDQPVLLTNGCFDILHRGHFAYLNACRRFGYLVVGVNSDRAVKLLKGEKRPINNEQDRMYGLSCMEAVTFVCLVDDTKMTSFIKHVKPNEWVKGGGYTLWTLDPEEREAAVSVGANIRLVQMEEGYSTTNTLEKLMQ
jgi:rfaE bifunctional protein nucleotidyltransferase chain/domain